MRDYKWESQMHSQYFKKFRENGIKEASIVIVGKDGTPYGHWFKSWLPVNGLGRHGR